MTVLTDYGLAATAAVLAARLLGRTDGQRARWLWGASFVAVALAAAAGGTWHGWAPRMTRSAADALWLLTYAFVGLGNVLILAAAAWAAARGGLRAALLAAVLLRFFVWFAFIARDPDFRYVVYDYAGTLIGLLVLAAWLGVRGRPGGPAIAAGVAVSLAGAFVQRMRLAPGPAFNHNDLFHVVQAAGLYLYYRGASRLRDCDARTARDAS